LLRVLRSRITSGLDFFFVCGRMHIELKLWQLRDAFPAWGLR
jgi:hypothetical protein